MRVISGKYRGRKLVSKKDESVRPTIDRVKESVFNILQFDIYQSKALDLFAGAGSYGIECISRGAKTVVFNDMDAESVGIIKQNTKNMTEDFTVINKDCKSALTYLSEKSHKFDLVFLDPPFYKGLIDGALKLIVSLNLLNKDGIIVLEHEKDLVLDLTGTNLEIFKAKSYGLSNITFLK